MLVVAREEAAELREAWEKGCYITVVYIPSVLAMFYLDSLSFGIVKDVL